MSEYRVCPHCGDTVSSKVYKDHERLYYNKADKTWITLDQLEVVSVISDDANSNFPSPPPTIRTGRKVQ